VRVGRFHVEIFSDGIFRLDGGLQYGIVPKVLWEKEQPADERNRVALDMNCLLIRDGTGNVVVVETGAGPKLTERSKRNFGIDEPPRLLDELARRGVLAITVLRMLPLAPFTIVNVVAGASHIGLRDFLLGTLLGMTPGILATVVFVDRIVEALRNPGTGTFASLAAVAGVLVALAVMLRRRLAATA